MAQYTPCGQALNMENLNRPITQEEYDEVVDHLFALGMEDGYVQELTSADAQFIPPFDLTGV
jgi:putative pyruvate formate lyase activating enzyme